MSTIKDIAREAGVSVMTVSNVIHGKSGKVAKKTVDRIKTIIKTNNYIPNMSARALVSKSSRIIGVINHLFRSKPISFFQAPFHSALLGGKAFSFPRKRYQRSSGVKGHRIFDHSAYRDVFCFPEVHYTDQPAEQHKRINLFSAQNSLKG